MIEDVKLINLKKHKDNRGFFQEIFRFEEQFSNIAVGQISHSQVNQDIIKCWHGHVYQSQWNYVVNGEINVVLIDTRVNSSSKNNKIEFIANNKIAYFFPPGVFHGYKCLKGPMDIIYITSGVYDLSDEIKKNNNDLNVNHSWC